VAWQTQRIERRTGRQTIAQARKLISLDREAMARQDHQNHFEEGGRVKEAKSVARCQATPFEELADMPFTLGRSKGHLAIASRQLCYGEKNQNLLKEVPDGSLCSLGSSCKKHVRDDDRHREQGALQAAT